MNPGVIRDTEGVKVKVGGTKVVNPSKAIEKWDSPVNRAIVDQGQVTKAKTRDLRGATIGSDE